MYVKQLELTRFKSFGGSTTIPLLPGFTVVSGPNGSGKSNILDAILFALGLSSSRGMRAEKLLDLVHSGSLERGQKRVETWVSVTFALESVPNEFLESFQDHYPDQSLPNEWKVTRRLRVNTQSSNGDGPSYTSTFYINDVPCSLTELHEQLEAMHVFPNGYNVVLQGDVTSIISMNAKERRQIIDELAGVATFDRKIHQANSKLEVVREQIERFRLIEQELQGNAERLLKESQKALDYQRLRQDLEQMEVIQTLLTYRHLEQQAQQTQSEIQASQAQQQTMTSELEALTQQLKQDEQQLTDLQSRIHALGEDEYLRMQTLMATRQAQIQQQQQQQQSWQQDQHNLKQQIEQSQQQQQTLEKEYEQLQQQQQDLEQQQQVQHHRQQEQEADLARSREQLQLLAQSSDAWVKQQRYLSRQLEETRSELTPLQQEQVRLQERSQQLSRQLQEGQQDHQRLQDWIHNQNARTPDLEQAATQAQQQAQDLAQDLSQLQSQSELDQATAQRLQSEQYAKQRELDKLETRRQVLQDTQGTRATQALLAADLPGVCGLVAQLGSVDPQYQMALEIAAGSRLSFVVVEDDTVAASAINFLKQEKAGRATFLPLNKLKSSRPLGPLQLPGLVDYAIRLVKFDPRYRDVFAFVLGSTMVFESLDRARQYHGRHRIVTLEGELLEPSGAMTGGSAQNRSSLQFGSQDNAAVEGLKRRLEDLEDLLASLTPRLKAAQAREKQLGQELMQARQTALQTQQVLEQHTHQLQAEQGRWAQQEEQLQQWQGEAEAVQQRLQQLEGEITPLAERMADLTRKLQQLEHSPVNQHWQQAQATIQQQETQLTQLSAHSRELEQQHQALLTAQQLNRAHLQQHQDRVQEWEHRWQQVQQQQEQTQVQLQELEHEMGALREQMQAAESRLADLRQLRDQQDFNLRTQQQQIQRLEWERYHAHTQEQEKTQLLQQLQVQLQELQTQLPEVLPEVAADLTLDTLQRQRRRLEEKLRALEPVNMLAITEYEEMQGRLNELTQKLETLQEERTELLLRIENFATLRRQAFMDAFYAVDQHFRTIFSQLSDGDGHLDLENQEDPLAGGLNLVAHPKGKPVRRLSSMSGGEKSLTALSFIFALQRYRPSSFYAFDEVDMFLDGANVERLARMIQQQAQQAQFIVVSLRRPMIEKADRTLGVTQARGAHTQVIGVKNRS
jgi:chromosome segregation protein